MRKSLAFITLLVIMLLSAFSNFTKPIHADGMIIEPDPYSDRWDYSDQSHQQAFINYNNGVQKMIISVGFKNKNNGDALWLFPVPSDPNEVVIDVVRNLPKVSGEEVSKKAKSNLRDIAKFLQITQFYTIPFVNVRLAGDFVGTLDTMDMTALVGAEEPEAERDVIVHEHIEKEGITSQIITAKTAVGLYEYLKNKGLRIESGSIPVLGSYIGKGYSFVASWVSSPERVLSTQTVGVFVSFKTKDIYYPMLPTSVYGSKIVPATIKIMGHVSPKIPQNIQSYTKVGYYIGNYVSSADDLQAFYNGHNQNKDIKYTEIKYTKIEINAPSKFLTEDLWVNNSSPVKTYYSTFVAKHPVISAIILLIVSSLVTGILVGWVVFKTLRRNIFKLGFIGLSNCLSIFGLLLTTLFINTKGKNESIEPLLTEIRQKGYFWRRRLAATLLLADSPLLLISPLAIFSFIGELIYSFDSASHLYATGYFMLVLISAVVLIFSLIIGRIRPEDRNLFEQLKLNNYSLWSFQPKDKAKIVFVPLFSVCFLIISWLLVKLVEFTV